MKKALKAAIVVALAVVLLLGVSAQAKAFLYADGCLVLYAKYDDSGTDTTVGLMVWSVDTSLKIYWNFLSQDGANLGHGLIPLQATTFNYSFSLKGADGNSHPGTVGYLIFTIDDNGLLTTSESRENLAANAVLINIASHDAAFLVVLPLPRSDYANVNLDLTNLNAGSITGLTYGHPSGDGADARYWIDPAFGAYTYVVIWTSQTPPANLDAGMFTINGDLGAVVTLPTTHSRLNVVNVATDVAGLPAGYLDGLIYILGGGGDRYLFSLIGSNVIGAIQTLLGVIEP